MQWLFAKFSHYDENKDENHILIVETYKTKFVQKAGEKITRNNIGKKRIFKNFLVLNQPIYLSQK